MATDYPRCKSREQDDTCVGFRVDSERGTGARACRLCGERVDMDAAHAHSALQAARDHRFPVRAILRPDASYRRGPCRIPNLETPHLEIIRHNPESWSAVTFSFTHAYRNGRLAGTSR